MCHGLGVALTAWHFGLDSSPPVLRLYLGGSWAPTPRYVTTGEDALPKCDLQLRNRRWFCSNYGSGSSEAWTWTIEENHGSGWCWWTLTGQFTQISHIYPAQMMYLFKSASWRKMWFLLHWSTGRITIPKMFKYFCNLAQDVKKKRDVWVKV